MKKAVVLGLLLALITPGCGGGGTKTGTSTNATGGSSRPAWQARTAAPKVTPRLIARAGFGLNLSNTNLGTVDEELGAMITDVHLVPSAKKLNDQYARLGRCMAEYMKIHDLGHELAVLIAYSGGKDPKAQAVVEQSSKVCAVKVVIPDAAFKQSLKTNP